MKNFMCLLLAFSVLLFGCSAVQKSESDSSEKSESVYIFDDISLKDSTENIAEEIPEPVKKIEMYIVQVGAFSTLDKAETFVSRVKDKIDYELTIHLRSSDDLQVVQLPPFRTREKAVEVRDELRKIKELEGTFIAN